MSMRTVVTFAIYQVGTLNDKAPWDHMGDDATNLREVGGEIALDVDEVTATRR